jgi:hypothetical protein
MLIAITALVLATLLFAWYQRTRRRDVRCSIDLECTQDHFHAHVSLENTLVEAGDEVLVHRAPATIPLGTARTYDSTATVQHASWLKRQWIRLTGGTAFHELYDVGFEG